MFKNDLKAEWQRLNPVYIRPDDGFLKPCGHRQENPAGPLRASPAGMAADQALLAVCHDAIKSNIRRRKHE